MRIGPVPVTTTIGWGVELERLEPACCTEASSILATTLDKKGRAADGRGTL